MKQTAGPNAIRQHKDGAARQDTQDAAAGGGSQATRPAPETGSGGNGLTRVTLNLTRPAVQALEAISDSTGYSKTDTINRALLIYQIIQDIMERNNGVLHVKHTDGETERIHIL